MKNIGNKVLIFYYFQLDSNRDYNVTTFSSKGEPPTIKDILTILPFDLTHGLYHFRFKSELTDGDEKVLAWIDINNIMAKVPQVNGSIYMKILKLKDAAHNKLFHLEKLKKADVVKINQNEHHFHSAPKNSPSPLPSKVDPNVNGNKTVQNRPVANQNQQRAMPVAQQKTNNSPSLLESAKHERIPQPVPIIPTTSPSSVTPAINVLPEKPKFASTSIEQNLQTFSNQFKSEQQNRENQRLAQIELQDHIRKWGYTDGKKINNSTTLLATLHQIWPEWEQVSLTDMLKPEQVNTLFKKAVIKVHPDKNRHRHFKEKYLSKRVFELLNESRKQM